MKTAIGDQGCFPVYKDKSYSVEMCIGLVLNDVERLVVHCIAMRLTEDEALAYLKSNGEDIHRATHRIPEQRFGLPSCSASISSLMCMKSTLPEGDQAN